MQRKKRFKLLQVILIAVLMSWMSQAHTRVCASAMRESTNPNRDKTGTNRSAHFQGDPQKLKEPSLMSDGSFLTEREGFEPSLRE